MNIRSRIKQFFSDELIFDLDKIRRDKLIANNNDKVDKVIKVLQKHNLDYNALGPGTNRFAILVDGYVVKIALDNDGVNDNNQEFMLSEELQPFVIRVYETNGLLLVTEYVTLIDREEFKNSTNELRQILSMVSDNYLIGDVGTVLKNYLNWGYRDNGELVILDFAYFFPANQELMRCKALIDPETGRTCEGILDYDSNFHELVCPVCGKKQMTGRIRARISQEERNHMILVSDQTSYKVDSAVTFFTDNEYEDDEEEDDNPFKEWSLDGSKEEKLMLNENLNLTIDEEEVANSAYDAMIAALMRGENPGTAMKNAVEESYREAYPQAYQEAVIGVREEDIPEYDRFSLEPTDEIELNDGEEEANAAYDELLNNFTRVGAFTIDEVEPTEEIKEDSEESLLIVEETAEEFTAESEMAKNEESTIERIEEKVDELIERVSTMEEVVDIPCDSMTDEQSMVEESPEEVAEEEPEIEITEEVIMDDDSTNESMGDIETKDEIEEESSAQNTSDVGVSYVSQIEDLIYSGKLTDEAINPSEESVDDIRNALMDDNETMTNDNSFAELELDEIARRVSNIAPHEGADVDVSKSTLTRL